MMSESLAEQRLQELGIELPTPPQPAGSYARSVRSGNQIFVSGQLPLIAGEMVFSGPVGEGGLSVEDGAEAARLCALNALSILAADAGGLDKVRIVRMTGYVATAGAFAGQAAVMNGASDLMAAVLADAGVHARVAVGVQRLPLDAAVELEVIAEVNG
jgi:enamine deaminase RidA (YjgF/YER057c/UK114 family)